MTQSYSIPVSAIKNATFWVKWSSLQEYIHIHNTFCYICSNFQSFHGSPQRRGGGSHSPHKAKCWWEHLHLIASSSCIIRSVVSNHVFNWATQRGTCSLSFQKNLKIASDDKSSGLLHSVLFKICSVFIVTVIKKQMSGETNQEGNEVQNNREGNQVKCMPIHCISHCTHLQILNQKYIKVIKIKAQHLSDPATLQWRKSLFIYMGQLWQSG